MADMPVCYWQTEETTFGDLKPGECFCGENPTIRVLPIWKLNNVGMHMENGSPSKWTDHLLEIEMTSVDQDEKLGRTITALVHSKDQTMRARPVYLRDDQVSYSKGMLESI